MAVALETKFVRKGACIMIKPVSAQDAPGLLDAMAEGELLPYVPGSDTVNTINDVERMVAGLVERSSLGLELHFSVLRLTDRRLVGMCALHRFDRQEGSCHVGYWIRNNSRRMGYGKEALRLLTEIAFSDLGLERLYAVSARSNVASARLLDGGGFKEEGSKTADDIIFSLSATR